jgi:hypothetical protein
MADRQSPTAKAGTYSAAVDTAGMDPEMKSTLGVDGHTRPGHVPFMDMFKKLFGWGQSAPKADTAAAKSSNVQRTSDVPHLSDAALKMAGIKK